MKDHILTIFLAAHIVCLVACDSNVPPEKQDAAPDSDMTLVDTIPDTIWDTTPDHSALEGGTPATCEQACTNLYPWLCTQNDFGECVECTEDSHCQANNRSFGPLCDDGICYCSTDADCTNHPRGPMCNLALYMCSCSSDADCNSPNSFCTPPQLRSGQMTYPSIDIKTCQPACITNKDCPLWLVLPICNTTTQKCSSCANNDHCSDQICNTTIGECVNCSSDTDCANHPAGHKCVSGKCSCVSDIDCSTGDQNVWGKTCSSALKRCSCDSDIDCQNSEAGSICGEFHRCGSCTSDNDCTSTKNKCQLEPSFSKSSLHFHCTDACTSDADCFGVLSNCSSGKCVQCVSDSDCIGSYGLYQGKYCNQYGVCSECKTDTDCFFTKPKCSTDWGECVECMSNDDCDWTYPFFWKQLTCDMTSNKCIGCNTDLDCANNPDGNICSNNYLQICTCSNNTNCTNANAWGPSCINTGSSIRCGCNSDAECATNINGPICETTLGYCSCNTDADCTNSSFPKCYAPYYQAKFKHCQPACTQNSDCSSPHQTALNICNTTTGYCVQCASNADCSTTFPICNSASICVSCITDADCPSTPTYPWQTKCDTTSGTCEECLTNSDCTNTSLGNKCDSSTGDCYCTCYKDIDCSNNQNGHDCDNSRCGCATDADCPQGTTCTGIAYGMYPICQ